MKNIVTISIMFFLYSCSDCSHSGTVPEEIVPVYSAADVEAAARGYNVAMIAKDTVSLNKLLHEHLSYGHSNGWVETREQQKENLYNGTIAYHSIEQPELEVIMNGNVATVRGNGVFDVDYKGTEHLLFDLNVMQTWIYEEGRWQMLNRQSVGNKK